MNANPGAGREPPAPQRPAVLVVDDESDLREVLDLSLTRLGLEVAQAANLAQARALVERRTFRLCLIDMRLPDGLGIELVRELTARTNTRCVVVTAYGSAENAVAALKAGAFDYLTKPVDLNQLRQVIRTALGEDGTGAGESADSVLALQELVGESARMVQMRAMIRRLGHSMAPVSIVGESGSGKELVARAIHACSERRGGPFIAVNCGAIPESLMEAEFFGHRRGAFTGADRDRDGFFQAARGGTLLLDELAELPLAMQVKLLRAIQERRIHKVGSTTEEPVDVRILSATHQDLVALVEAGRFRHDLFYRLNVIELAVPSLRERTEDIPALAARLLDRISARAATGASWLDPAAIDALRTWPFPGNVRELENVLERAVVLTGGGAIDADHLVFENSRRSGDIGRLVPGTGPGPAREAEVPARRAGDLPVGAEPSYRLVDGLPDNLQAYLDDQELGVLRTALERTGSNRTAAAHLLGLSLRQMRYRMQRLGLK